MAHQTRTTNQPHCPSAGPDGTGCAYPAGHHDIMIEDIPWNHGNPHLGRWWDNGPIPDEEPDTHVDIDLDVIRSAGLTLGAMIGRAMAAASSRIFQRALTEGINGEQQWAGIEEHNARERDALEQTLRDAFRKIGVTEDAAAPAPQCGVTDPYSGITCTKHPNHTQRGDDIHDHVHPFKPHAGSTGSCATCSRPRSHSNHDGDDTGTTHQPAPTTWCGNPDHDDPCANCDPGTTDDEPAQDNRCAHCGEAIRRVANTDVWKHQRIPTSTLLDHPATPANLIDAAEALRERMPEASGIMAPPVSGGIVITSQPAPAGLAAAVVNEIRQADKATRNRLGL